MTGIDQRVTVYRPLPRTAEGRAYIVGGILLRKIDRSGLRPSPDRLHVIDAIAVYRRRWAVYSIRIRHADACAVVHNAVDEIGLHMAVLPPSNGHVDLVCDLYARDALDYYDRI
jgi:hypothetical protein